MLKNIKQEVGPLSRFKAIRERTGLSAHAFGLEMEREGVTSRDYYMNIDAGRATPKRDIEEGIIRVNAGLRSVPFNQVLLELRGKEEEHDLVIS